MAPRCGKEVVVRGHGLGGNFGELAAGADECVGGENARTSGIRKNGEPRAFGARLFGKNVGDIEDLADRLDAQDAGTLERGVEHIVAAGE